MKDLIKRNLSGKKILILFILTSLVYAMMLTITVPKVMNFADGMKLLDMLPTGYTPDYVNSLFNALGQEGRNAYLFQQIPLDLIYPGLFGVTYCLLFAFILKKLGKEDSHLFYLCFIPVFAVIFDYLENIGIIIMLKNYPDNAPIISQITNVFSISKSTLVTISFIILFIFLLALLTKYIATKNKNTISR
jgi:hypothetical protein